MKIWNIDIESALRVVSKEEKEMLLQEANRLLEGIFIFDGRWDMEMCKTEVKNPPFDHIENNDPEWLYQNNRHGYLESVALSYLITKDQRYLSFFTSFISSWIKQCPYSEDKKNGVWRSLEVGLRASNWLLYLQLLYPYLDKEFIESVNASLLCHGEILASTYTAFHKLSNWGVLQDEGLFLLGIYFENKEWIKLSVTRLTNNIQNSVMDDGSHWEQSPMYTGEVLNSFLSVINVAKQHNIGLPQILIDKCKKMTIALTYFMKSDGCLFTFGDTDKINARDLIAFSAVIFEDSYLKGIGECDGKKKIYLHCSKQQIDSYNQLEIKKDNSSKALTDSKNFFLKSGKVETLFSAGALGSGHGHADTLALNFAYDGYDIFVDPGRYTYKNEEMRLNLKKSSSHNTFTIDGEEFTPPLDTWAYKDIALTLSPYYKFSPSCDVVEGSHIGYKNTLCKRTVIRLEDEVLLIFDTIYKEGRHYAQANFNLAPCINPIKDNNTISFKYGSIISLLDSEIEIKDYQLSMHYNEIEEAKRIVFKTYFEDKIIIPYLIDIKGSIKGVEVSDISFALSSDKLSKKDGIAVNIKTIKNEYVVMFIEKDVIGLVDLFKSFDKEGYGSLIVFKGEEKILNKY